MILQQAIYSFLFISSVLFVEKWRERFAILLAYSLFTLPPVIYNYIGTSERDKFLYFIGSEIIGALFLPLLLKGNRTICIFLLQILAACYFFKEYLWWFQYTWTYQYYEIINMLLLDLTLAILLVKPEKKLTIIHFLIYVVGTFFLWSYSSGG